VKRSTHSIAALLVLATTSNGAVAQEVSPPRACKERPEVVDQCYMTRGRFAVYNGNPSFRIWKVGTNRLLGVREGSPEDPMMPHELFYGIDARVFADFLVCPLTKERPGWMQMVCVQSAENIRVEKFNTVTGEVEKTFVEGMVEMDY